MVNKGKCYKVINCVTAKLTYEQNVRHRPGLNWPSWYFPTYVGTKLLSSGNHNVKSMTKLLSSGNHNVKSMVTTWMGEHCYTGDFHVCRTIYLLINVDQAHWFLVVVGFVEMKVFVLDSLMCQRTSNAHEDRARRLVKYLHEICVQNFGTKIKKRRHAEFPN